jgi:hypothetical protein
MTGEDLVINILIGSLVIGFIISFWYLIKSTEKRIEYEINSYELIPESLSGRLSEAPQFKILSEDQPITSLTSSEIKIENTGFLEIKPDNLTPEHPIQITAIDGKKIYHAQIKDRRGMDNHFDTISRLDGTGQISNIQLSFHHINRGDGVKIQVFHSGNVDSDLVISGTLVGGPIVSKKKMNKKPDDVISIISLAIGYSIFVIVGIFYAPPSLVQTIGTGVLIFIVVLVAALLIILMIRKFLMFIYKWLSKNIFKTEEW